MGLGLAAIFCGWAVVWNLGFLWRLAGLPANPASGNATVGLAVGVALGVAGAAVFVVGVVAAVMLGLYDPPMPVRGHRGPASVQPPTPAQIPTYPPLPNTGHERR